MKSFKLNLINDVTSSGLVPSKDQDALLIPTPCPLPIPSLVILLKEDSDVKESNLNSKASPSSDVCPLSLIICLNNLIFGTAKDNMSVGTLKKSSKPGFLLIEFTNKEASSSLYCTIVSKFLSCISK